ncbi:MAG: 50S ribosomal protein L29 [Nitrososphaerota archaeon]
MKELKQLREMSEKELMEKLDQLKSELRKARSEIGAGGAVAKPTQTRNIRRSIARVLTVLNERRRGLLEGTV